VTSRRSSAERRCHLANAIILNPMSRAPEKWPVWVYYSVFQLSLISSPDTFALLQKYDHQCTLGWTYGDATPVPVVTVERLEKEAASLRRSESISDAMGERCAFAYAATVLERIVNEETAGNQ
jgi:hypothetical protein